MLMIPPVLGHMKKLGYAVFTEGVYNLNIFGIRGPSRDSDKFDDIIGCAFKTNEEGRETWQVHFWPGTTDPGSRLLVTPINKRGAAILCSGQYRGVYRVDTHNGRYNALCQRNGPVTVYRDNNKDCVLDMIEEDRRKGYFGINIHKRGGTGEKIRGSSAGCQVFKYAQDFDRLMLLAKKQIKHTGDETFTYTLLDQWW